MSHVLPRVTEKAYRLSQSERTYVFTVPSGLSKQEIAARVAAEYEVTVENVRVLVQNGKPKRGTRGKGKVVPSARQDIRKAYVRLKEGDTLPFFAGIDTPEEGAAK